MLVEPVPSGNHFAHGPVATVFGLVGTRTRGHGISTGGTTGGRPLPGSLRGLRVLRVRNGPPMCVRLARFTRTIS